VKALAWEAVFGSGYFGTIDLEGNAASDMDCGPHETAPVVHKADEDRTAMDDDVTPKFPEAGPV